MCGYSKCGFWSHPLLLSFVYGCNLLGHDGQHFNIYTIELIKTSPSPCTVTRSSHDGVMNVKDPSTQSFLNTVQFPILWNHSYLWGVTIFVDLKGHNINMSTNASFK